VQAEIDTIFAELRPFHFDASWTTDPASLGILPSASGAMGKSKAGRKEKPSKRKREAGPYPVLDAMKTRVVRKGGD
jgi:hypothetical protein